MWKAEWNEKENRKKAERTIKRTKERGMDMEQEKYEVWFAGIRGLGARKKYLLHEALESCRNAYYIEETQLKKFPFLTEKDCQEIRQAQKMKDQEKRNPYNPVFFGKISKKITSACGFSVCIIRERKASRKRY